MIDIAKLSEATFDIKLKDSRVLNLKSPNKTLFNDTLKMADLIKANQEDIKTLDLIYNFITKILNRNTNNIKLSSKEVEDEIDVKVAMFLVTKYTQWVVEIDESLNF